MLFRNSSEEKGGYNSARVIFKIQRNWASYFYRMGLILSSISLCSLACYYTSPDDNKPDRIAHVATMLLTGVAFMFIVYTSLPQIPYLTYMDWYTISQFGYMVMVLFLFVNQVNGLKTTMMTYFGYCYVYGYLCILH
eukprot:UN00838